jgi:hypothetical protein
MHVKIIIYVSIYVSELYMLYGVQIGHKRLF